MKKYLFPLLAFFAMVLVSCDKSDPDARDAFVGTYVVNAQLDYTYSAQGKQETGSMPLQGKVTVSKSNDEKGVLISGDIYCSGTVEGDMLQIEPQHFRRAMMQESVDMDITFEPAKLVDNTLKISGKATGSATVSGMKGTFDGTISAVATKQ